MLVVPVARIAMPPAEVFEVPQHSFAVQRGWLPNAATSISHLAQSAALIAGDDERLLILMNLSSFVKNL